jgi:hypothetical protein
MAAQLDHILVPARDKIAAARLVAELLGVPWSPTGVGPFAPVFVNEGLTLAASKKSAFSGDEEAIE